MTPPPPPPLPYRHSLDNPYDYSYRAVSRPEPLSLPLYQAESSVAPPHFSESPGPPIYSPRDRSTSFDGRLENRMGPPSPLNRPTLAQPLRSSSSSGSGGFPRKLLKKSRANSSSSSLRSGAARVGEPSTSALPSPTSSFDSYPYSPLERYPSQPSYRTDNHRYSVTSSVEETEEEQMARIQTESLEYEQQRQMDLEMEEDRRLQEALAESALAAEQERIYSEERSRLQRLEEEIALREALVYSREFEQAEMERKAAEARARIFEEEQQAQRTLTRSRTLVGPREYHEEPLVGDLLSGMRLVDLGSPLSDRNGSDAALQAFSSPADDQIAAPPSYSPFATNSTSVGRHGIHEEHSFPPTINTSSTPHPPPGASRPHFSSGSSGEAPGLAHRDVEATQSNQVPNADWLPVSTGLYSESQMELNRGTSQDSSSFDTGSGQQDLENPFDDHFAAGMEDGDDGELGEHEQSGKLHRSSSATRCSGDFLPAGDINACQASTASVVESLQSRPQIAIAAPAPTRHVSEPPPTIASLAPGPRLLPSASSAANTPQPSPSLSSFPHAPSCGGIVEDPSSNPLASEHVTDGVRWGFVSLERASMHPPLESRGDFPRGAQLSSAKNEEGKAEFMSFAIEAKSWAALLVYLTWFGRSRFEASPHDHAIDENEQSYQVSIRIEFFRSFVDSACRVRCRLELLPLSQSRPLSQETTSAFASTAETDPSFDSDCPNVHIALASRPQLPLNLTTLATLLASTLSYSRQHARVRHPSASVARQACLAQAVDFLRQLDGEQADEGDNGNESDEVGWTDKLKSRLRRKKIRELKNDAQAGADRRSELPEGALMITPFSIE
ncbi:uncharacterized protein JCM15063_005722 [Sporobolomyces koalae]|uniref:uncharacterized protein n=1 Tax=Sporobolomyces koalae TaxID=500713 RepID=UPI0031788F08